MRLCPCGLLLGIFLIASCSSPPQAAVGELTVATGTVALAEAPATPLLPTQNLPTTTLFSTPVQPAFATQTPALTPLPTALPTQAATTFRMCSPLALHPLDELPEIIGDPYHPPPPNRAEERHHGVDFSYYHWGERDSMLGEPVQAVLSGFVAAATGENLPYGNMVIVETPGSLLPAALRESLGMEPGDSLYILYAHLNKTPLVSLGETVVECQLLGEVGMTGRTAIPHLHLETRLGPAGSAFAGMRFYDTHATREEMENYVLWRTSGVFRHFDPMKLLLAGDP